MEINEKNVPYLLQWSTLYGIIWRTAVYLVPGTRVYQKTDMLTLQEMCFLESQHPGRFHGSTQSDCRRCLIISLNEPLLVVIVVLFRCSGQ